MNVYIEYVLLDNLTIDILLLWAAAITLKLPFKWWRLILGGTVGAVCAIVSVFVQGWLVYVVKTACLVAMCVTACGIGKKLLWYILLVTAYTFVLGGAIIAVFHFLHLSYITENGEFYNLNVPLFVYVLAVFFTAFLCYSVVFYVKQTRKVAPYLTKAKVKLGDSVVTVPAFCDSGNSLTFNDLPVCFVTKRFNGFADYFAKQTLSGKVCKIEVTTVAGTQTVCAVPGEVEANGKRMHAYLAIPADKIKTTYNVILSNAFIDNCASEQQLTANR
ncbi:MAG: sigma-E processing peptidase SpoIIGA [Clostridia bacterium]|nr:sigma-E processing peptidase SpoIIGA [Clostridia bacterium]